MKHMVCIFLLSIVLASCQSQDDRQAEDRVIPTSQGATLQAILVPKGAGFLLNIELRNATSSSVWAVELGTHTLSLADAAGAHVGLASNPATRDKIIVLGPGQSVSTQFELSAATVGEGELYLTHYSRFEDIGYNALKVRVANQALQRTRRGEDAPVP